MEICLMTEIGNVIYTSFGVDHYFAYVEKLHWLGIDERIKWYKYDIATQVNMMNLIWIHILVHLNVDTLEIRLWLLPTIYADAYIEDFKEDWGPMVYSINALGVN